MKSFFGHKNKKANFKLQPKKLRTAKDNLKQDKKIIKKRIFKNTCFGKTAAAEEKSQDFFICQMMMITKHNQLVNLTNERTTKIGI